MMAIHNRQTRNAIQSVDSPFYSLMSGPRFHAIEDHDAKGIEGDINLKTGDIFMSPDVGFQLSSDGDYVNGINTRTGLKGRAPMNKLEVKVEPLDFDI